MNDGREAEVVDMDSNKGKTVRTALVTGGSRGIGRGIAFALAARGYDLAISHWQDGDNARAVSERIGREFGRRCEVFEGNLEEEAEPGRLAKRAIGALERLEVLVNNAGITLFAPIGKVDLMHIDRLYRIDFRAPVLLMQAVCTHMIEQGIRGRIVNIVSTRAERSYAGDAVYGGMKAALARARSHLPGRGRARHPGQRRRAGRDQGGGPGGGACEHMGQPGRAAAAVRHGGRHRPSGGLARLGRGFVHHGDDSADRRRLDRAGNAALSRLT